MLNALTKHLTQKRVTVYYSVDVEVKLDIGETSRSRTLVTPHNIHTTSEEHAKAEALRKERCAWHSSPILGEPKINRVRRVELREGW